MADTNQLLQSSTLGKKSSYISQYQPDLLFPVPRQAQRDGLGIQAEQLPFTGYDFWQGYELSWLTSKGKPQVALLQVTIPAHSPYLIESKSFKLYLNSFNQTRCENWTWVAETLKRDLSQACGAEIQLNIIPLCQYVTPFCSDYPGHCIDDLDISCEHYQPKPELLTTENERVNEALFSHLLKSNCLVTGQPDWGSLYINYQGQRINPTGLLQYIVSLRQHNEFHEHCVERIFTDIQTHCQPEALCVMANYTRRGGLDINPVRTTDHELIPDFKRLVRQ
jgi:7-cyano-7-deazaguanine reductase